MAAPQERVATRSPDAPSRREPAPTHGPLKAVNGWFLRFSKVFGVFGAASREERDELSAHVLRRLIAAGYAQAPAGGPTRSPDEITATAIVAAPRA